MRMAMGRQRSASQRSYLEPIYVVSLQSESSKPISELMDSIAFAVVPEAKSRHEAEVFPGIFHVNQMQYCHIECGN